MNTDRCNRFILSRLIISILFFYISLPALAVTKSDSLKISSGWHAPLNIPASLSANYGELRGGHFHAGIDLRVGGVVGEPVLAVKEGFVSRILVSSSGYGNALYITHTDGKVSVYGHLHDFISEIADYVKKEQYAKESFRVNIYLAKDEIKIEAGQKIGRAGNTGSSGGPHLHLEIREGEAAPLNIISRGYISVKDNIAPQFNSIAFYSYSDTSGVIETTLLRKIRGSVKEIIELPERSFIGIEANDRQNGTHSKLAIEEYRLYLDDQEIWSFKTGEFLYSESGYINSVIDYEQYLTSKANILKTFIEPGNILGHKYRTSSRGLIELGDDKTHKLRVEIYDEHGNRSSRIFNIKRKKESLAVSDILSGDKIFIPWFKPNYIIKDGFNLYLPVASIYRSIWLNVSSKSAVGGENSGIFSDIWSIHTPLTPMHRSGYLKIEANVPDSLQSKALFANVSLSGSLSAAGGYYKDGYVCGNIGSFGDYCVTVDTIPPIITPRFKSSSKTVTSRSLDFTIRDEFSGINSYRAEIDGKWILAEFDQKSRKLSVILDKDIVKKGKESELVLTVTDNKGNTSQHKYKFVWK